VVYFLSHPVHVLTLGFQATSHFCGSF